MTVLQWLQLHRHTQISLILEMRRQGASMAPPYLSQVLRGVAAFTDQSKEKITAALKGIGATDADIAAIEQLRPAAAPEATHGNAEG